MKNKRILIISPHADDEVLGCGGMISKYSDSNNIYVAIMTNASIGNPKLFSEKHIKIIRSETLKAHKMMKIKKTFFYEFPAPNLDQYPQSKISDVIKELILKIKPQLVFIPHIDDIHTDHNIISKSSLVALRPNNKNKIESIIAYETLSETEWSNYNREAFKPNLFIELSNKNINEKIKFMKQYKSQIKKYPNTRSIENIKYLSKYRGSIVGKKFAEAFIIIREEK